MGRADAGDSMQAAEATPANRSGRGRQQRRTVFFDVGGSSLDVFAQSVRLMTVGLRAVHHDCFRWLRATNEQRARNRGCINHSRPQKIASSTLEPNSDLLTLTHVQGYCDRDPRGGSFWLGLLTRWAGLDQASPSVVASGRRCCSAGRGKGKLEMGNGQASRRIFHPIQPFHLRDSKFLTLTHPSHPSSLIPPPSFSPLTVVCFPPGVPSSSPRPLARRSLTES
jgi:hypothetical protein